MRQHRLVHIGVAAALAAAAATAVGLIQPVGADGSGTASVFVPITPCRLADTRPAPDNVGTRTTPIGPAESVTFVVWGTNGHCAIPTTATGIAANVTAVNPTAGSYLTIYPADANPRPAASNLNYGAGSPPTPNQVTVGLSATGAIAAYNNGGSVDVIVDVVGYYQVATGGGAQGPQGIQGIPGPPGANGTNGIPGPSCPIVGCTVFYTGQDAFNPGVAAQGLGPDSCLLLTSGAFAYLDLDLPAGALIKGVRLRYFDLNLNVYTQYLLQSRDELRQNVTQRSQPVTTTDTSGNTEAVATLSLNAALPAQSRTNQYQLSLLAFGSQQDFCGAEVSYTFG